jgi:prolyl oligopeptidase
VKIPDPYRWLEDLDSKATRDFVTAENQLTDSYLAKLPGRDAFRARLAELTGTESYGGIRRRGARYFWVHNTGKQDQSVLFTAPRLDDTPTVLLDPNVISPDGSLAFAGFVTSPDGARFSYGLSVGGGDWQKWHVRNVKPAHPAKDSTDPGGDAPDELQFIKYYAPSFAHDGKGLYYSRFPAPAAGKELSETDHDCKVYFHVLGTPVEKDVVVYERPDHPSWQFEPWVTPDGHYLTIAVGDGEVGDRGQEQIVYLDLTKPSAKPVSLIDVFEAEYDIIGNEGPVFYLKTTLDALNKRVIAIDTRTPARSAWKEIVPAGKDAVQSVSLAAHQIFVTTLQDAQSAVAAYDLKGKKIRDVTLPGIGSVGGFGGLPDDKELFYGFTSFLTPGSVYRYDVKSGTSTLWKKASVPFDATAFETKQVFYPSKDGTKIPLFLIEKKGLALDGGNPVLLTGYGGFGHAQTPYFSSTNIAWLEQGGIVAIAGLRGGGEYGEAWHKAGTKTHKQVVFDDFIAAGEWLIANKYTSKEKLGVYGGSNGGLLIGAVVTQRPDLFAAAASLSGVLDMIRFPLFGQGAGWEGDYGSPENEDELKALFAYSPVHNTHPGTHYPATLVVTADHDVRVAPLHSYKFAAALQAAQAGDAPVLLRVETTSGHGGGTTRSSQIDQRADMLAFFLQNLGGPRK